MKSVVFFVFFLHELLSLNWLIRALCFRVLTSFVSGDMNNDGCILHINFFGCYTSGIIFSFLLFTVCATCVYVGPMV